MKLSFVVVLVALWISALVAAEKSPTKNSPAQANKNTAAAAKSAEPKKTTLKVRVLRYVGNITSLDAKSGAFRVKGNTDEKDFVAQDAAKDALERLKVGERVRVQYSEREGKHIATSVRRMKLPQTKSAATTTSAKRQAVKETKTKNQ